VRGSGPCRWEFHDVEVERIGSSATSTETRRHLWRVSNEDEVKLKLEI
jgi:hypothetical protein